MISISFSSVSRNQCDFLRRRRMETLDPGLSGQPHSIPAQQTSHFDPIDNDMENEDQRLRSFQRNKGWQGKVDPQKLAAAGFYYTGINDNVKCFACDVSLKAWMPTDDPVKEHLKNQPNCTYISSLGNKFSVNFGPSLSLQEVTPTTSNFGQTLRSTSYDPNLAYNAPLASAVNRVPKPNYTSEHARLHSFINWPKDCPVQPKELIDAGFFYTGNGDKAECFKCGIILAGWEPQDTPWGEHEKWSKDCPLVVEHLHRRNPRPPSQGSKPPVFPQEQTWDIPNQVLNPTSPVAGPAETEEEIKSAKVVELPPKGQGECSKKAEENQNAGEASTAEIFYIQRGIYELVEDGKYELETINEAVKQRTKIEGRVINSKADLLDAVQSYKEASNLNKVTSDETRAKTSAFPSSLIDPEQVQKLEDAHRCKICLDAEIGIVFLPCGHLVCCPKCAKEIQTKRDSLCPICRRHIQSTIRSYLT